MASGAEYAPGRRKESDRLTTVHLFHIHCIGTTSSKPRCRRFLGDARDAGCDGAMVMLCDVVDGETVSWAATSCSNVRLRVLAHHHMIAKAALPRQMEGVCE